MVNSTRRTVIKGAAAAVGAMSVAPQLWAQSQPVKIGYAMSRTGPWTGGAQVGQEPNYLMAETKRRGEDKLPWHMYHDGLATLQAARPVRELTEPVGHAMSVMSSTCVAVTNFGTPRSSAHEAASIKWRKTGGLPAS